ncbi:MAG: LEA type 2 family protein [Deltaproteobacteria bacterium]|nr:LEA type 2 family protein [Deltaproteobacteria bacterium]
MEVLKRAIRLGSLLLLFVLMLFFFGCAGLGKRLEPPGINVANIQVQEVKAFETVLKIDLRLINPNDVPLDIKGLNCNLELNGKRFASGVANAKKVIPPYGTGVIPVVVYSSVFKVIRGIVGLQGKENLTYRLKGRLRLEGNRLLGSTIPFESAGVLSLKALRKP